MLATLTSCPMGRRLAVVDRARGAALLPSSERPPRADLPTVEAVDRVPLASLPAFLLHLTALLARGAVGLKGIGEAVDDCECFEVEEVARRLKCSVDLVRERGEEWNIAKVLTRDKNGKPTRVVYPRALLRAFLATKPAAAKRPAA